MRTMQFHPRKPSISHQPRRIHKLPNHTLNIPTRHLPRRRKSNPTHNTLNPPLPNPQRNRTRRNRRRKKASFASATERLATWVAELDDSRGAVLLAGFCVFGPGLHEGQVLLFGGVGGGWGGVEGAS